MSYSLGDYGLASKAEAAKSRLLAVRPTLGATPTFTALRAMVGYWGRSLRHRANWYGADIDHSNYDRSLPNRCYSFFERKLTGGA